MASRPTSSPAHCTRCAGLVAAGPPLGFAAAELASLACALGRARCGRAPNWLRNRRARPPAQLGGLAAVGPHPAALALRAPSAATVLGGVHAAPRSRALQGYVHAPSCYRRTQCFPCTHARTPCMLSRCPLVLSPRTRRAGTSARGRAKGAHGRGPTHRPRGGVSLREGVSQVSWLLRQPASGWLSR